MVHLDASLMTFDEGPQGQICRYIQETSVKHINHQKIQPCTEKNKEQMFKKGHFSAKNGCANPLVF